MFLVLYLPLVALGWPVWFVTEVVKDFWYEVILRRQREIEYAHSTHRTADAMTACFMYGLGVAIIGLMACVFLIGKNAR